MSETRETSQTPEAGNATTASPGETLKEKGTQIRDFWYDKQHRDLLFYLSIAIFFLELIVGAVAFFYGVIHAEMGADGVPRFRFPWVAYAIAAIMAPAGLLLIVHLAGVGLFRSLRGEEHDEAWRQDLPERLRKVYAIIQGAPTVVLLIGLLLLGTALYYIDGALAILSRLGSTAEKYLPWCIGGATAAWCVGYLARIWFNYRSKRLEAEFAFRREVLEKTGIIIVENGSMRLPPAREESAPALEAAPQEKTGPLPPGQIPQGEGPLVDVTPDTPPADKT